MNMLSFQVDVNQSTVQQEQMQLPLEERTLFEGYCPLPVNRSGTWTTEIKFNISNDGARFTDTYNVFIYQSQCQEYHYESGNVFFTLKVNYRSVQLDNVLQYTYIQNESKYGKQSHTVYNT